MGKGLAPAQAPALRAAKTEDSDLTRSVKMVQLNWPKHRPGESRGPEAPKKTEFRISSE